VKLTVRSILRFPFAAAHRIIDAALAIAILGFLILFLLQFSHAPKLDASWLITQLHRWGDPLVAGAGSLFNWRWPSPSLSFLPIAVALLTWAIKIGIDATLLRGLRLLDRLLLGRAVLAGGVAGLPGSEGFDTDTAVADSEQAREQLLKRYREIEKALKSARRKRCTFLSVDVVGSTEMKVGEMDTAVAASFQAYEELLRKIFEQYGAWKQAWTPDGVMVCFLDRDLAVSAAQRVLQSLERFNESENQLRIPFRVRCGLSEGEVAIYEDSKLEKVADHVIDVAGHMQKQGRPNVLWVPAEVYNLLNDKSGFQPVTAGVDGTQVYEWLLEPS
jgi:class 3 adenylate cyclase